jgi:DNA-binding transcriptional MerR regulator/methylmalonyl-CoA mutase cobalamin-binding subunit
MNLPKNSSLGIAAVERETGLSKDVLRKWEVRYGFPAPLRDAQGERAYPLEQVDRLRLIKRLMDGGMRPSRLVNLDAAALAALAPVSPPRRSSRDQAEVEMESLALLRERNPERLRQHLYRELLRRGAEHFVLDVLVPLNQTVGEAWARGELDIHEEHAYTEVVQGLLRGTNADLNLPGGSPRILLTTLPEEQHGLGLLMAATLFTLNGAYCLSLGTQTPVRDIAQASHAHRVDVVALSFSTAYPQRRILPALDELRRQLDDDIAIWAGGAGTARIQSDGTGLTITPTLPEALAALSAWRPGRPEADMTLG